MNNWIDEVKAGDAIFAGGRLTTVVKVRATQIHTKGYGENIDRWNKENNRPVGYTYSYSQTPRLRQATPEAIEAYHVNNERLRLFREIEAKMQTEHGKGVSLESMKAIHAILFPVSIEQV